MKRYIILMSIIFLSVSLFGQNTKDTARQREYVRVWLKNPKKPFELVRDYVEREIKDWARKGKYESTEEYEKRVSLENRKTKEQGISREAINKYGAQRVDLQRARLDKSSYNPDNETFKIIVPNTENFRIKVPRDLAQKFENNWDSREFKRVEYGIYEDNFVVYKADLVVNYQTYRFNAKETADYGKEMKIYVYSSETRSMFPTPYSKVVRKVKKRIDSFKKRGEFETLDEYKRRTADSNIVEKEKQYTREALKTSAKEKIDLSQAHLKSYDINTKTFPVEIPGTRTIQLPVPVDEGPYVKQNWDYYQFKNVAYGLYKDQYVIDSLQVNVADSVYSYNSKRDASYGGQVIRHIDMDSIQYDRLDDLTYAMFFDEKRPDNPPDLFITNVTLEENDGNNALDAKENAKLKITIRNNGKGQAFNTKLKSETISDIIGLEFEKQVEIGEISGFDKTTVNLPISGKESLPSSEVKFKFQVKEPRDYNSNEKVFTLETNEFKTPRLKFVEPYFATTEGGKIKKGESAFLKLLIENRGEGVARDVTVTFNSPENVLNAGKKKYEIGNLQAGESKAINYEFIPNKLYSKSDLAIEILAGEQYGKYGNANTVTTSLGKDHLPFTEYNLTSDVDKNIPENDTTYTNRFAVIIGNEDYKTYQEVGSEANVAYATADAIMFRKYANRVLGIPKANIVFEVNALKHDMQSALNRVTQLAETNADSAEIFFFYAGHGFPDQKTHEAFIMPVNITGAEVREGIKLGDMYRKFTQADNVSRVTGFIDACFSGGGRAEGLLAARAVKIKPKETRLQEGKLVVFSASSGQQVSLPYEEKNHGMFTYALLKKLQETRGFINYGEMKNELIQEVQSKSRRVNNKQQTPKVNVSPEAKGIFQEWKFTGE